MHAGTEHSTASLYVIISKPDASNWTGEKVIHTISGCKSEGTVSEERKQLSKESAKSDIGQQNARNGRDRDKPKTSVTWT